MNRVVYILLFFPFVLTGQGSLVVNDGFESLAEFGNTSNLWRTDIPVDNSFVQILTSADNQGDPREGTGFLKMVTNGATRNEIVRQGVYDNGIEYWVGYSMRIVTPFDGFNIVTQIRPLPSGVNPLTLRTISGNRLRIATSTDETYTNATPGTSAEWNTEHVDYTYQPNTWLDMQFHFLLDDTNGYFEVWINDTKVLDIQGGTTIYTRDIQGNPKQTENQPHKIGGYYGSTSGLAGEVDYDAFKIWRGPGGTRDDVKPIEVVIPGVTTPAVPTPLFKSRRKLF